jgi:uncharacterized metal-binding protein
MHLFNPFPARPRTSRTLRVSIPFLLLVFACAGPGQTGAAGNPDTLEAGRAGTAGASGVDRILEEAQQENRVMGHLWTLAREIGPRLTSSTGLERAQQWCLEQFESWGLDAQLESWGEFPVGFDRGPSHGVIVGEGKSLTFVTPSWTRGTDGPERGRAILEPTVDEASLLDADGNPIEKRVERRRALKVAAERAVSALEGQLEGAWIVRRPERPSREMRKVFDELCVVEGTRGEVRRGGRGDRLMGFGSVPDEMDDVPSGVRVLLLEDHYRDLVERLEAGEDLELEFDIQNTFREGPIEQHNVVADLVGTEFPDEFVIVQAHLDSWDVAEGACDNGTGVATTMEAARLITAAGLRPRRTIRFILYGGEEQGLFGSRGYVRDHEEELDAISIVLNHDEGTNYLEGIRATYAMWNQFEQAFAPVLALDPDRPFRFEEVNGVRGGPSDHSPFARAGVPAFHWLQSTEGYNHIHHTQHDKYEMADEGDQRHNAQVVALAAWGFAELNRPVDRTDIEPLSTRRMGVRLDGTRVTHVSKNGKAAEAGWQEGDRILAVDGEPVTSSREITSALQLGDSKKHFRLSRLDETIESALDYSGEEEEEERSARASRRAAWATARE